MPPGWAPVGRLKAPAREGLLCSGKVDLQAAHAHREERRGKMTCCRVKRVAAPLRVRAVAWVCRCGGGERCALPARAPGPRGKTRTQMGQARPAPPTAARERFACTAHPSWHCAGEDRWLQATAPGHKPISPPAPPHRPTPPAAHRATQPPSLRSAHTHKHTVGIVSLRKGGGGGGEERATVRHRPLRRAVEASQPPAPRCCCCVCQGSPC